MLVQFRAATLGEFVQKHAADISAGGMFVETDRPVAVGTELTIKFTVAGHPMVECKGRVVRHGPNGMGIQFVDIPQAVKLDLQNLGMQFNVAV